MKAWMKYDPETEEAKLIFSEPPYWKVGWIEISVGPADKVATAEDLGWTSDLGEW